MIDGHFDRSVKLWSNQNIKISMVHPTEIVVHPHNPFKKFKIRSEFRMVLKQVFKQVNGLKSALMLSNTHIRSG